MTDVREPQPAWWEHLTGEDRTLLARLGPEAGVGIEEMRGDETAFASVLAHPAAFAAVWGDAEAGSVLRASPFLVFATAIHRGWAELQEVGHVDEWVGFRRRLPVLGGDDIREFLASPGRRFFLAALLGSYTKVMSGTTWVRTPRGWRRRRFSDLDPVRLASLLEVVPPEERPGVYRRLGDLALFLTGVFPDRTESHGFGPIDEGRLLRAGGVDRDHVELGPVELLERLGQRWYRAACRGAGRPLTSSMTVVAAVADEFTLARRVLNVVTDRYLFPVRGQWFGEPAA